MTPERNTASWFSALTPSARFTVVTAMWIGFGALAWFVVAVN
jgi:hypothetical protein